jgi:hypothetical protein
VSFFHNYVEEFADEIVEIIHVMHYFLDRNPPNFS